MFQPERRRRRFDLRGESRLAYYLHIVRLIHLTFYVLGANYGAYEVGTFSSRREGQFLAVVIAEPTFSGSRVVGLTFVATDWDSEIVPVGKILQRE